MDPGAANVGDSSLNARGSGLPVVALRSLAMQASNRRKAMTEPIISSLYYTEFRGETFVIQAEAEAVEKSRTTQAILHGIQDLLSHDIKVALVFGKSAPFEQELCTTFHARLHPETNRLVIPETALRRVREERAGIAETIQSLCRSGNVPCTVLPESVIRAERRIGHQGTGVVTEIDIRQIQAVLSQGRLAILGFGGEDDRGQFLHIPSVSLAADLAVGLGARKLLLLTRTDGIFVPDRKGNRRLLSFADFEELLCLLQRKDERGNLLLAGRVVPKVHASIRAVAGNVSQVHLVSYSRLLDEILTRTGVGTMIERQQSHQVDYARVGDLEEIERLHAESQRYRTDAGTPYVKPLDRAGLERRLPQTLVLKHRGVIVGKLQATEIPEAPENVQIGGFVVGENHQDSQHGQLLLSEALGRLRARGYAGAAAITASERAKRLFERTGALPGATAPWQTKLLNQALERYAPEERSQVELFQFTLQKRGQEPNWQSG
jgi:acetylglutamate kinase